MKLIRNKKGGGQEIIADIPAYIVFVMVVIFFLILFSFKGKKIENQVITEFENKDGGIILRNLLRTPVELNGEEMMMIDLLSKYYFKWNSSEKQIIKEEVKKILDKSTRCLGEGGTTIRYGLFLAKGREEELIKFGVGPVKYRDRKFGSTGFSWESIKSVAEQPVPWYNKTFYAVLYSNEFYDSKCE